MTNLSSIKLWIRKRQLIVRGSKGWRGLNNAFKVRCFSFTKWHKIINTWWILIFHTPIVSIAITSSHCVMGKTIQNVGKQGHRKQRWIHLVWTFTIYQYLIKKNYHRSWGALRCSCLQFFCINLRCKYLKAISDVSLLSWLLFDTILSYVDGCYFPLQFSFKMFV